MDAGRMNYLEPHWTGELQLEAANNSIHGGFITTQGRYWDSFMEYCNANALNILKQELRKQGVNVRQNGSEVMGRGTVYNNITSPELVKQIS